jgi:hypothetical protein
MTTTITIDTRQSHQSPSAYSYTDESLHPRSASFKEEAATRLERTAEYIINSTISQDITGGMEKNQNESLAALAAKLVKLHEVPFERQERNLHQKSSNLAPDTRVLPQDSELHRNTPGAMSRRATLGPMPRSYQKPHMIPAISHPHMGRDFFGPSENRDPYANFQPPHHLSIATYDRPSERYEDGMNIPSDCSGSGFGSEEDDSDSHGNDNEWATSDKKLPMNRVVTSTMPSNPLAFDNDDEEQIFGRPSSKIVEFHKPVSLVTATDLREMQNVFSSLNADEKEHMNSSGLDPISYYFAYLKDDAPMRNQEEFSEKSDRQDTTHENIGTGEEPLEGVPIHSKGSTVSERLHTLQASIPEREQLRLLEESLAKVSPLTDIESQSPSHHSYKTPKVHSSPESHGDSLSYTKPSPGRFLDSTENMTSKVSYTN